MGPLRAYTTERFTARPSFPQGVCFPSPHNTERLPERAQSPAQPWKTEVNLTLELVHVHHYTCWCFTATGSSDERTDISSHVYMFMWESMLPRELRQTQDLLIKEGALGQEGWQKQGPESFLLVDYAQQRKNQSSERGVEAGEPGPPGHRELQEVGPSVTHCLNNNGLLGLGLPSQTPRALSSPKANKTWHPRSSAAAARTVRGLPTLGVPAAQECPNSIIHGPSVGSRCEPETARRTPK